ncbi:MAG: serine/threonine-protein kinase [Polyangiaceae bacterium]
MIAGRTLGGRYVIRTQLGRGGMGAVYEARDEQLDRRVALKLLTGVTDAKDLERFRREATSAARLEHPNIVQIYELAMPKADEPAYLVMERLVGEPLSKVIARDAPFRPARALRVGRQIASALAAAHAAGIIHRDIKPSNVMLVRGPPPADHVKVVDFGLARDVDARSVTTTGAVLGTVTHMSPEQAMGAELGPTCDVWAVGLVLYQMLTRALPHKSTAPGEIIAGLYRGDLVPIRERAPSLPPTVLAIVERAMAISVDERYASAGEMLADLERVAADVGDDVPAAPPPDSTPDAASGPEVLPTIAEVATTRTGSVRPRKSRREPEAKPSSGSLLLRSAAVTCGVGVALAVAAFVFVSRRAHPRDPALDAASEEAVAVASAPALDGEAADPRPVVEDGGSAPMSDADAPGPWPAASRGITVARPRRARVVSTTSSGARSVADSDPDRARLSTLRASAQSCVSTLVMPLCDDGNFSVAFVVDVDTRSGRVLATETPAPSCRVRRRSQRFGLGGFESCVRPALRALDLGPARGATVEATTRFEIAFQFLQAD